MGNLVWETSRGKKEERKNGASSWRTSLTFRLEAQLGKFGAEAIQGVISLAKLRAVSEDALDNGRCVPPGSSPPRQFGPHAVHVEWNQWCSAAYLQCPTSKTVLQPKGTQIAEIFGSAIGECHAMVIIYDFNQRLLRAPPKHWNRALGHPTGSAHPSDELQSSFEVSTSSKALKSKLFGGTVRFGLDFRWRVIQLGKYNSDVLSSKVFRDCDRYMIVVVSNDPGVSLTSDSRLGAD